MGNLIMIVKIQNGKYIFFFTKIHHLTLYKITKLIKIRSMIASPFSDNVAHKDLTKLIKVLHPSDLLRYS